MGLQEKKKKKGRTIALEKGRQPAKKRISCSLKAKKNQEKKILTTRKPPQNREKGRCLFEG